MKGIFFGGDIEKFACFSAQKMFYVSIPKCSENPDTLYQ